MLNFLKKLTLDMSEKPLGGRYKIIRQLGKGGFGHTFLAQDIHLPGHPVCVVKQLKPQVNDPESLQTARRLFDTEAKVLYELGHHDQIPRLLGHFEDDQEFYLAQEYIEGKLLNQILIDGHPWQQGRVFALLQDILQVLTFVHRQNVIHRDINPSNLVCRKLDGRIVLIDFGAVKQVNSKFLNPPTGQTNFTVSIGTPGYMPSEQFGGNPRFSSDVYAVGIIGIQALTGIHPRHFGQDPHTGEIVWEDAVDSADSPFAKVLNHMVRYDYRTRYPTAAEALAALQSLASEFQEKIPAHWHLPVPTLTNTPDPQAPSQMLDSKTKPTWVLSRPVPTQSKRLHQTDSSIEPTLVTEAHYHAGESSSFQKKRNLPVFASSISQEFRGRWLWILSVLAGLGVLLLVLRTCSSSQPVSQVAPTKSPAETQPTTAELLSQAEVMRDRGQYQQALDIYDQVISNDSESAVAYWGRCYSLNKLLQLESALIACDQAISLNPDDPRPLSSKGFALHQQQRYQEALELFDRAIEVEPDNAEAWSNRGTSLLKLERLEAALQAFEQAIKFQPELAKAWNNRGATLWSLGQFEDAIASVNRAIELDPDYEVALNLRQQMRERLNR